MRNYCLTNVLTYYFQIVMLQYNPGMLQCDSPAPKLMLTPSSTATITGPSSSSGTASRTVLPTTDRLKRRRQDEEQETQDDHDSDSKPPAETLTIQKRTRRRPQK